MKKSKESMKTIQINNKHYIECDVVMLPTNGKSKLYFDSDGKLQEGFDIQRTKPDISQHLYITSDEKPKENDWYLVELFKITGESIGLHLEQCKTINGVWVNSSDIISTRHIENCKKIIATTDSKLHLKCGCGEFDYMNCQQQMCEIPSLPQIPSIFVYHYIPQYNKGNVISKIFVEVKQLPFSTPNKKQFEFGVFADENNEISITLHEVEPKVYSREEVLELIVRGIVEIGSSTGLGNNLEQKAKNWIEQNL
jgi:hypothetical protein